ncbi:MAG TPA: hypothetical protein VK957_11075 [Lunatimonas sp.]|nr:hypothetical protein [Lunatimonas sp.]
MGKLEDVQKLIETFKMERVIYVVLTSISAMTLIGIGLYVALVEKNYEAFFALLVPTGTLTLCIFRVLKMWDDALRFISSSKHDPNE